MSIKIKLILFFLIVKVIPVLIIFFIALFGANKLNQYLHTHTTKTFTTNSKILEDTTKNALNDTIKFLDKKSQESLEKTTYHIAQNIANFLYERDKDLIFLSKIDINQNVLKDFYKSKYVKSIKTPSFKYNEKSSTWERVNKLNHKQNPKVSANLKDNNKEFHYVDPVSIEFEDLPIYKEISFFNTEGKEIYKISDLNANKINVFNKKDTYLKAENFQNNIQNLKKGNIYVSDVIGEYVPSKLIGKFTKEKADKVGIKFKPENYAFAGLENPVGKKFEGIIRFITPVYKNNKKIAYISLALDHKHIMNFTDKLNPVNPEIKQSISDASSGNYAFMWDYEGRNISHPRDYFISGFNKDTGTRVMPWLSSDVAEKYKKSNQNINEFLNTYPKFEKQSLKKKPNLEQLKKNGNIALDCRYLNFAPQCEGWMQLTENGGYGSFIIYWSKVWKLTTAATIPYYTGKYAQSKRGFGFVTIGANVEEFHEAVNKTKNKIDNIVAEQKNILDDNRKISENIIDLYIKEITNELSIVTFIMIILVILIAIWMSNYITKKIEKLVLGTKYFSNGNFDYEIKVTSNDEIGQLEKSFNSMSKKIKLLIQEQKDLNTHLEEKVKIEVEKQSEQQKMLIQQSKLAHMGEMIGNIAHQWRQPLNALGLLIQHIEILFQSNTLDKKSLDEISSKSKILIDGMSETIDDFMYFFSPKTENENFKIYNALDKALNLFKARKINYEVQIDNNITLGTINGNKNALVQVLLNLLTNAKDSLDHANKQNGKIYVNLFEKDDIYVIEVHDNGLGIKDEILERIFEPYFTTKFKAKGTGIGLYMSKLIIEENLNGTLNAKNSKDGAIFTITLAK